MSLLLSGNLLKSSAAPADTAFRFTVQTAAANETFQIFAFDIGTFNATVDWGDGNTSTIAAWNDRELTHVYATAGTHSIAITGTFPSLAMGASITQAAKIRTVTNMGSLGWLSLQDAFYQCSGLTSFAVGEGDLSGVSTMFRCFTNCTSMTTCDMTGADTSAVTTMNSVLSNTPALTSVPGWAGLSVGAVTNFSSAFRQTGPTAFDLSGWDFSSAAGTAYNLFARDSAATFTGIGALDFTSTSDGNDIFRGVVLPKAEYDAGLIAWAAQAPAAMTMEVGVGTNYTLGGAAEAAHTSLIKTYGWTFQLDAGV